jgi:antitoxin component YwqK of YwqJK toxin-antitoxin module
MHSLKKSYIRRLFTDPQTLMYDGIYMSGYKGEGVFIRWYPNGQRELLCHYENGVRQGVYKEWHQDGKLAMVLILRNGTTARVLFPKTKRSSP